MPTCPFCRYDNVAGTTHCVMCCASLVEVPAEAPLSALTQVRMPFQEPIIAEVPKPSRMPPILGINSVALYIDHDNEPLILDISNQAILGRYTPNSTSQPRIDLTRYRALERGVSRLHAIIRRTSSGFALQDLASSNGTWLNGVRLQPYVQSPMKSGDHFRLSEIEIELYATGNP